MAMQMLDLVTVDPAVLHGQACIRGTRIPVSVILDCIASGMAEADIRREYPSLPDQAIQAALSYGALLAREEVLNFGSDV
jgi:uncharacterized protein (DUF433 family)